MKGDAPRTITLLTDFGARDSYVAAMKGVIAGISPEARVIDICHEVPPQDIFRGGMIWAEATRYFPRRCVHVAVVDPGVGSQRRILGFEARGSMYLAPDNGIVGLALSSREVRRIVHVRESRWFLPGVSSTFHGRDIFAPVAARLSLGLDLGELGPRVERYQRIEEPRPRIRGHGKRGGVSARGEITHIDSFGNAITNLRPPEGRKLLELRAGGVLLRELSRAYSEVEAGRPLALVGSSGRIEISVNRGSAEKELRLSRSDPVVALWL